MEFLPPRAMLTLAKNILELEDDISSLESCISTLRNRRETMISAYNGYVVSERTRIEHLDDDGRDEY